MISDTATTPPYDTVLEVVRSWPTHQRLLFVQQILATISVPAISISGRQPTLAQARGLLALSHLPPSDEDVDRMRDERRKERYGV